MPEPAPGHEPMDPTLNTYELAADTFIEKVRPLVEGNQIARWIHEAVDTLPKTASMIELGSGSGRDATFIESLGFHGQRTDGAKAFVDRLKGQGRADASQLNVITDELGGPWSLIYANAVLLHLTKEQFRAVLTKVKMALNSDGTFAFSVKEGEGAEWESDKLSHPRFFQYWHEDELRTELDQQGFGNTTIGRGSISSTVTAEPHTWLFVTTHRPS